MIFAKIDANLDAHPKIRRAGRDGREVFLFVLRRNALADHNGTLPVHHLEPWYLADQLMIDEATASNGLLRAVTAGLLRKVEGGFAIVGWDDEWAKRPLTNSERQERFRQKHNANHNVEDSVTNSNDSTVTNNASNGSEERRGEEIRVEEKRVRRARAPAGTALPSEWQPSPEHVRTAARLGLDLGLELGKFVSNARGNGRQAVDWNAVFEGWLLESSERRKAKSSPTNGTNHSDAILRIAHGEKL